MSIVERMRRYEMRVSRPHWCVFCGHRFMAVRNDALVCGLRCGQLRWRANSMLAGTHAFVGNRFVRLKPAETVV